MKYENKNRILLENIAIWATLAAAVLMFITSFITASKVEDLIYNVLDISRAVQRSLSIVLIITSVNLMKRKRVAWVITILVLILNLVLHIFQSNHWMIITFMVCEVLVLLILLVTGKDFCCPSDRKSMKIGFLFLGGAFLGIVANAGLAYHEFRVVEGNSKAISVFGGIVYTIGDLFDFSTDSSIFPQGGIKIETIIFWLIWICIILAVLFIVKPFVNKRNTTAKDLEHARILVNKYGQNAGAYLTLEDDKILYFGRQVDGVIAYGVVGDTIVINGDPICADGNFPALLDEFTEFAVKSAHHLFFLSVTDRYLEEYKRQGYGWVKCGEEARFDLQEYDIAGKKGAKMRANINHATKAGLTVAEYKVAEKRDAGLDAEFQRISDEWLEGKNSSQLAFTLGGVGLEEPMDKRYFYAVDETGKMQGFIVFCPFGGDQPGYMADVTRRGQDAPGGVMEKIMYEAFQVFKAEGKKWGSMGLAPLANLVEEGQEATPVEKLLTFIYDNLNNIYGFKNLYRAKEKYSPSSWEPGYFIYMPKVPTPQMIYAVIRIQNPQGILDYVKAFFKENGKEKKLKQDAKDVAHELKQGAEQDTK